MSAPTLAEWSDRLAKGDREALAEMYRRYSSAALQIALAVLRSRAEAEEIVQQTFLEVWQSASRYQPERSSPGAWVARIARARAIDRLRTRSVHDQAVTSLGFEPTFEAAQASLDAEAVRRALAALPVDQAHALELAYYQGLSHSEIAAATGASLGTIKTRLRLGMFKLAEAFAVPPSMASPARLARPPT